MTFDELLAEAEVRPVTGWDFSWLGDRMTSTPLPWSYDEIVGAYARESPDLLDMGTGGGNQLAGLAYRPPRTVATEAWEPNGDVAGRRLRPLGVTVVRVEGAPDNVEQAADEQRGRLPFPSESFQLVVNRHESFVAREVARVLVPGGRFVTQQVGGSAADLHRLLGLEPPARPRWNLALAREQLEAAGLTVGAGAEGEEEMSFADVGALAWYLRAVPWEVPSFTIERYRARLAELHAARAALRVRLPAFWVEAVTPSS